MKRASKSARRIYLDYAATTPIDPRVLRAMEPYFTAKFGNPGSLHGFGQEAIAALDRARETVADALGAGFRDIVFAGSATEANNLALGWVGERPHFEKPRIIVSAIEHESVLEAARALEARGADLVYLQVDACGLINLADLRAALNEQTVLVSIMYANNEMGAVQPIAEIGKIIREFRGNKKFPLFHSDAAQAFQYFNCDVRELGVDLLTISSHKIYGPKGAAALYVSGGAQPADKWAPKTPLRPLIFGGGQEYGLRSGTENVPAIVGFVEAVRIAAALRAKESKRVAALRNALWDGIKKTLPDAAWNGVPAATHAHGRVSTKDAAHLLPNILNVYLPGHIAEDILTRFDLAGVAISSGSACRSRALESSYVIEAVAPGRAKSSVRFSLGRGTTVKEVEQVIKILGGF